MHTNWYIIVDTWLVYWEMIYTTHYNNREMLHNMSDVLWVSTDSPIFSLLDIISVAQDGQVETPWMKLRWT